MPEAVRPLCQSQERRDGQQLEACRQDWIIPLIGLQTQPVRSTRQTFVMVIKFAQKEAEATSTSQSHCPETTLCPTFQDRGCGVREGLGWENRDLPKHIIVVVGL